MSLQVSAHMQQQLAMEKQRAREYVRNEFAQQMDPNDPVEREMHSGSVAVQKVFGGTESQQLHELQLVKAWRPSANGSWELANGVIHRVHHDNTVTVQFLPDQHRCVLPFMSVQPHADITPVFPEVVLAQGERLPTPSDIALREKSANAIRQLYDIPGDAPIPGLGYNHNPLGAGEHYDAQGHAAVWGDHWAMPASTQVALRNRSVPSSEITGVYGQHFYSNLYKNRFYPDAGRTVSQSGQVDFAAEQGRKSQTKEVHRKITLDGQELLLDMKTGVWHPVKSHREPPSQKSPGMFGF